MSSAVESVGLAQLVVELEKTCFDLAELTGHGEESSRAAMRGGPVRDLETDPLGYGHWTVGSTSDLVTVKRRTLQPPHPLRSGGGFFPRGWVRRPGFSQYHSGRSGTVRRWNGGIRGIGSACLGAA